MQVIKIYYVITRGCTNVPKSSNHHELPGRRRAIRSKFIMRIHKYYVAQYLSNLMPGISAPLVITTY